MFWEDHNSLNGTNKEHNLYNKIQSCRPLQGCVPFKMGSGDHCVLGDNDRAIQLSTHKVLSRLYLALVKTLCSDKCMKCCTGLKNMSNPFWGMKCCALILCVLIVYIVLLYEQKSTFQKYCPVSYWIAL